MALALYNNEIIREEAVFNLLEHQDSMHEFITGIFFEVNRLKEIYPIVVLDDLIVKISLLIQ